MTKDVDLRGLPRDTLLALADRACSRLCSIASQFTTDEGDKGATEEAFGLDASEVVEMAHDNMIADARRTLDSIIADAAKALGTSTASPKDDTAERSTEPRETRK